MFQIQNQYEILLAINPINSDNIQMNNINDLKIELIPVFITIMDTLSLTKTANKLGVTQSAVSHSLKKLQLVIST